MILVSLQVTVRPKMLGTFQLDQCVVITDDRGLACQSLAVLGLTSATIEEPGEAAASCHPDLVIIALANPTSMAALGRDNQSLSAPATWVPRILIPWFPAQELWRLGALQDVTVVLPGDRDAPFPVLARLRVRHLPALFLHDLELHLPATSPVMRVALRKVCLHRPSLADPPCRSVRDVAERVGCSTSYLYSEAAKANVDIGAVIRHCLILEGVWLRAAEGRTWADVSLLLGFPSSPSWSNFVRRHWHTTPSAAQNAPPRLLIGRSLAAALRGPGGAAIVEEGDWPLQEDCPLYRRGPT